MLQKLQKVGDTQIVTAPQALLDQHQLSARQHVDQQLLGTSMTIVVPACKPDQLVDLVAQMNEHMAQKREVQYTATS